ncbi:hypothetical protein [Photobacterium piscicola]|uniref:hypothetical protein n=2 Tax=Photobacterium TaxID=657 RepID=UPI003735020A
MRTRICKIILYSLVFIFLLTIVIVYLCANGNFPFSIDELRNVNLSPLFNYYEKHIRGNLFAGLISVGGFLMTGKTFILVTMKQNVFDDKIYIENYIKMRKHNPELSQYGPLVQLKDILYYSVYFTIISAIIQITIGLIPFWYFSLFSIFTAIFSIALVIDSLNLIKKNLDYWIKN